MQAARGCGAHLPGGRCSPGANGPAGGGRHHVCSAHGDRRLPKHVAHGCGGPECHWHGDGQWVWQQGDKGAGCGRNEETTTAEDLGGLLSDNVYGMEPVRCGRSTGSVDGTFLLGIVSEPAVFYNGFGFNASIISNEPGVNFHFLSAYVTPWHSGAATFVGFRDGVEVARYHSPVLKHSPASPVNLNFGTALYNI